MLPRSACTAERIKRRAIHHAADVLQPLADLDVIDRGVDRREGAQDLLDLQALFRTAGNAWDRRSRGAAMPPPIQIRMHESAVGSGCLIFGFSLPSTSFATASVGSPAIHAAAPAAASCFKKSRRTIRSGAWGSVQISFLSQDSAAFYRILSHHHEFRLHKDGPKQILNRFRGGIVAHRLSNGRALRLRRFACKRKSINVFRKFVDS